MALALLVTTGIEKEEEEDNYHNTISENITLVVVASRYMGVCMFTSAASLQLFLLFQWLEVLCSFFLWRHQYQLGLRGGDYPRNPNPDPPNSGS